MGFSPRTHAVFGVMGDKALDEVFAKIAPWIDHWHFCDLPTPRAATAAALAERFGSLRGALKTPPTVDVSQYADPWTALLAAKAQSEPADRIVVFGSFFTVGGVMAGLRGSSSPAATSAV
jgi:dihydrofolate synthase/folylpolyglutamate synthase